MIHAQEVRGWGLPHIVDEDVNLSEFRLNNVEELADLVRIRHIGHKWHNAGGATFETGRQCFEPRIVPGTEGHPRVSLGQRSHDGGPDTTTPSRNNRSSS